MMRNIKVAILDMNDEMPNEGMRCIRDVLQQAKNEISSDISWEEFEVRKKIQIPTLDHDIFISSGGPGSPLTSLGSEWENAYFKWLSEIDNWNRNPNNTNKKLGGEILCIEKERPHIPLERAVMAIRFNPYIVGTQFHPEADAQGMSMYLQREDKKQTVIQNHGIEKWNSMIEHLNDPDKISLTNRFVLPNFLKQSIAALQNPFSLS